MKYPIDPFPAAIARTLQAKGFVRTATTIILTIADGHLDAAEDGTETRRAYTSFEQQQICADLVEENIILPYAAWEAAALHLGQEELIPERADEHDLEERLLVTTAVGGARQLGSFSYRSSIEGLRNTINRLRGMEPPLPGGGSPPSPPAGGSGTAISTRSIADPSTVSAPKTRSHVSTWFEADADALASVVHRSLEERLPFAQVLPALNFRKQFIPPQVTNDWPFEEDVDAAEGSEHYTVVEEQHGFKP